MKTVMAVIAITMVITVSLWMIAGYAAMFFITHPSNRTVPSDVMIGGLMPEELTLTTEDEVKLAAWRAGKNRDRAVILLPGLGANRGQCKPVAEIFMALDFDVLLPDLRGSGRSGAARITFGWNETRDVKACFNYLRQRGYKHIGAYGVSMGAATIAYALKEIPDFSFVILESSYDTMTSAINNRMDTFHTPRFLAWAALFWGSRWIDTDMNNLCPVNFLSLCKAPALIISGNAERFVKASETKSLYDNCASTLKRLHIFKKCSHGGAVWQSPQEYKQVLTEFIQEVTVNWR